MLFVPPDWLYVPLLPALQPRLRPLWRLAPPDCTKVPVPETPTLS